MLLQCALPMQASQNKINQILTKTNQNAIVLVPSCNIFNVLPLHHYEEDENKCFTTPLTWFRADGTKEDIVRTSTI